MTSSIGRSTDHNRVDAPKKQQHQGFSSPYCSFEIYREDQTMVTSTRLSGGDWRWRLVDSDHNILAAAGGFYSETACRQAVSHLQRFASSAKLDASLNLACSAGGFASKFVPPEPVRPVVGAIVPEALLILI
jgi:uncharacterized protein YegP (UPF0339 family)